jgi:hypothetical protein
MVKGPLEQLDIDLGKKLLQKLRRLSKPRPFELRAAAWILSEDRPDWQLYVVTLLVDTWGPIQANLIVTEIVMSDAELNTRLRHRINVVGRQDRYARWLYGLRPVGDARTFGDLEIRSAPSDDGIEGTYIYLST